MRSGDDVGDQQIFEQCDFVAQSQLALFETLQLDHVDRRHVAQCFDCRIKVTVIAPGDFDSGPDLVFIHAATPCNLSTRPAFRRWTHHRPNKVSKQAGAANIAQVLIVGEAVQGAAIHRFAFAAVYD